MDRIEYITGSRNFLPEGHAYLLNIVKPQAGNGPSLSGSSFPNTRSDGNSRPTTIVVRPVMIFGDLVLRQICEVTDEDGIAVEINQV